MVPDAVPKARIGACWRQAARGLSSPRRILSADSAVPADPTSAWPVRMVDGHAALCCELIPNLVHPAYRV